MNSLSQLFFNFPDLNKKNPYHEEDFVILPENSSALKFLKKFFEQKDFSRSQNPALILRGSKACGKTHLLNIFAQKFDAEFITKNTLEKKSLINSLIKNHFYIVENIEEFDDEELLLNLVNSCHESGAFLILSTKEITKFKIKDLNSRLKNILVAEINEPSLESLTHLLANRLSRLQISLSSTALDMISKTISRNYDSVLAAVKKIEFFCHENKRSPTTKEIRQIL